MKHAMSSVRVTARNVLLLHQLRHRVFATGQLFRVILSSTSAIYLLQPVSECGRLVPALLPKYGNQPTARTSILLTLKVVSESRVMWATSVPILVFLGLSGIQLGPMYATDVRQHHRLMAAPPMQCT